MTEENKAQDIIATATKEVESHKVRDFIKKHKTIIIELGVIAAAVGVYAAVSSADKDGDSSED